MSSSKRPSRGKEKAVESTPSKKKSKSTPLEYDSSYFINSKGFERYQKFAKKHIHTGCFVRFNDLEEFNLRTLIELQGWVKVFTLSCPTYPFVVQLFYSNLVSHHDKPDVLKTKVLDNIFLLDPEFVGKVLGVPNDGADIFDETVSTFKYPGTFTKEEASKVLHGDDFPHLFDDQMTNTLLPRPRVLANLLGHTIIPKSGSRNVLYGCHKLLTVCLIKGIKVNLPLFLIKAFWHISEGSMNLYYGKIITMLVEGAHISLKTVTETLKPDKDYGSVYINLMKSSGALNPREDDTAQAQASTQEAGSSIPTAPLPTYLDLITYMKEFEERMMKKFEETKMECMSMINSTNRLIENNFNYIYAIAGIEPPPPPPKQGHAFDV